MPQTVFAPAKLNLFLAITGRRPDGFHDLVSVVAPLAWGDTLQVEPADAWALECNDPEVPVDGSNLVWKAAEAFAAATGWRGRARFVLEKRIPAGAGLGGGSSDAVAAVRALEALSGRSLGTAARLELAARLGSDCPLFLQPGPVVMRGRGERIESLPPEAMRRIQGRRVLVFKPGFGVPTAWAYAQLAAKAPASYLPAREAEARLALWLEQPARPLEELLFNNMEAAAFGKFVALPTLVEQIARDFRVAVRMSGSGSACFALLREDTPVAPIVAAIRDSWGESACVVETRLGNGAPNA